MLTCEDAILVAIDEADGIGRTALQKVIFFAKELGLTAADYRPHYYGPYSHDVAATLLNLVAAGWVQELAESWPDDSFWGKRRRYAYRLTDAGKKALQMLKLAGTENQDVAKLRKIVQQCRERTHLDFQMLSWAAKIRFLNTKINKTLTSEEIEQQARSWGWQVSKLDVPKVEELLKELNLDQSKAA